MEIQELFAQHRAHFVDQLQTFYEQEGSGSRELLVVMDDDDLEGVFQFYRADLVDSDGNAIDFEPEEFLSHDRLEISVSGTRLVIDPFVWSKCDISLEGEPGNWESVLEWVSYWLNLDEDKKPNKMGVLNVLHQMTTPERDKEGWTHFSLDLGTVPAAALKELVALLVADEKIKTVLLSSPEYTGVA